MKDILDIYVQFWVRTRKTIRPISSLSYWLINIFHALLLTLIALQMDLQDTFASLKVIFRLNLFSELGLPKDVIPTIGSGVLILTFLSVFVTLSIFAPSTLGGLAVTSVFLVLSVLSNITLGTFDTDMLIQILAFVAYLLFMQRQVRFYNDRYSTVQGRNYLNAYHPEIKSLIVLGAVYPAVIFIAGLIAMVVSGAAVAGGSTTGILFGPGLMLLIVAGFGIYTLLKTIPVAIVNLSGNRGGGRGHTRRDYY